MSYWNGKEIVVFKDRPYPNYPGWVEDDCGCCTGLLWGGESPTECDACGGGGFVSIHIKSGAVAYYPGGPFCGKVDAPYISNEVVSDENLRSM